MMTSLIASVPPVDAPIPISFSVPVYRIEACLVQRVSVGWPNFEWPAAFIFSTISAAYSVIPCATPSFGFAIKSTAPNSNARSVASAPRSVSVEIITTGVGIAFIITSKNRSPSTFGISMSRVITSGLNS